MEPNRLDVTTKTNTTVGLRLRLRLERCHQFRVLCLLRPIAHPVCLNLLREGVMYLMVKAVIYVPEDDRDRHEREVFENAWWRTEVLLSELERLQFALGLVGGRGPGIQALKACEYAFRRLRRLYGRIIVSLHPQPADYVYELFKTTDDEYLCRLPSVIKEVADALNNLERAFNVYSQLYHDRKTMFLLHCLQKRFEKEELKSRTGEGRYDHSVPQGERKKRLRELFQSLFFEVIADLEREVTKYCDKGIPVIKSTQKARAKQFLNQTGIATFLSLVTVTLLPMTTDKQDDLDRVPERVMRTAVNTFLFSSLAFSIASAVNSLLAVSWLQSIAPMPTLYLLNSAPVLLLAISIALFVAALCLFVFSSGQHPIASIITVSFAGLCTLIMLGLTSWFVLEIWHSGRIAVSARQEQTKNSQWIGMGTRVVNRPPYSTPFTEETMQDEWMQIAKRYLLDKDEFEQTNRAETRQQDGHEDEERSPDHEPSAPALHQHSSSSGLTEINEEARTDACYFIQSSDSEDSSVTRSDFPSPPSEATDLAFRVPVSNSEEAVIRPRTRPIYVQSAKIYIAKGAPPNVSLASQASLYSTGFVPRRTDSAAPEVTFTPTAITPALPAPVPPALSSPGIPPPASSLPAHEGEEDSFELTESRSCGPSWTAAMATRESLRDNWPDGLRAQMNDPCSRTNIRVGNFDGYISSEGNGRPQIQASQLGRTHPSRQDAMSSVENLVETRDSTSQPASDRVRAPSMPPGRRSSSASSRVQSANPLVTGCERERPMEVDLKRCQASTILPNSLSDMSERIPVETVFSGRDVPLVQDLDEPARIITTFASSSGNRAAPAIEQLRHQQDCQPSMKGARLPVSKLADNPVLTMACSRDDP